MSEAKGRIGFEEFIEAWESSDSVGDACKKLGMEKPNAYARATKYRGEGIPLKKFPGGGGRTAESCAVKNYSPFGTQVCASGAGRDHGTARE